MQSQACLSRILGFYEKQFVSLDISNDSLVQIRQSSMNSSFQDEQKRSDFTANVIVAVNVTVVRRSHSSWFIVVVVVPVFVLVVIVVIISCRWRYHYVTIEDNIRK